MPSALIAEDEPLLAQGLYRALAQVWPELAIVATVGDGLAAAEQALQHRPDVVFLDVRMPGQSGIDAAAELTERWDAEAGDAPFPALVFITAYEQYALQAFEAQALDYLVKPLQTERLRKTVERLRRVIAQRAPAGATAAPPSAAGTIDQVVAQLRGLLGASVSARPAASRLSVLQASIGNVIHMVALDSVLLLEAADKYVRVLTAEHEYLIRTPLRELLPRLDPDQFWQVHRSAVVRATAIDTVTRDEAGRLWLQLRGRSERLAISRLHAHRFKPM